MTKTINEEKRGFPRIKSRLKVALPKNISGESIDISDGGLSFNAMESIDSVSSPAISLQVNFPDIEPKFKTQARLVWKRNLEDGSSEYGVEFIGLSESQKTKLREELIKAQIDKLLGEIKNADTKSEVSCFFLKDVLGYINEMIKLLPVLSKENEYCPSLEEKLEQLNNQLLLKGYCLEELLSDKKNMQKVKEHFRQLVGTWVYKSVIMKRGFEKPRGYPGDYKIIEIGYDNKPISKIPGKYLDNYFLKTPYAVAIRTRKDRLRDMVKKHINETKLNQFCVLNIACGSCREIRELLPDLKTQSQVVFTCLDWDEEALKFSEDKLLQIKPKNAEFKFVKEDIMNMINDDAPKQSLGKQDLIYSIGLIDYLPDRVLKKLIYVLYESLEKDGKLILTHKNREKTFPPIPPDWFCDWKFVSRNKEEATKLFYACGISDFSLSAEADDFEYIYYFTVTKNK